MRINLITIFFILVLIGCTNDTAQKTLLDEAESYREVVTAEATHWLANLDEKGYSILLYNNYPAPFNQLIEDSIKSQSVHPFEMDENKIDSIKRDELQNWINEVEQKYGAVQERTFRAIHIITKGKLLTYLPGQMKGFQEMNPKMLGVKKVEQLYLKGVEGTYAILMYESKPSKRERAEELLMFWLDENNYWAFLTYKIADNI